MQSQTLTRYDKAVTLLQKLKKSHQNVLADTDLPVGGKVLRAYAATCNFIAFTLVEGYARFLRGPVSTSMRMDLEQDWDVWMDDLERIPYIPLQTAMKTYIELASDGHQREVNFGMTLREALNTAQKWQIRRRHFGKRFIHVGHLTESQLKAVHTAGLLTYVTEPGYVMWITYS